jgi:TetR/AcrR family transcriptional regulator, cholesterol catabolism regulator
MIKDPANNRELIIQKTYEALMEQGYKATSIKTIAQAIGIAPGLIHYYFKNKEELIIAVLDLSIQRCVQNWDEILQLAQTNQASIESVLTLCKDKIMGQFEIYRLRYELYTLGLTNPMVMLHVNQLLQAEQRKLAEFAALLSTKENIDYEAVAAVLSSALDGLVLRKMADSAFDMDQAYDILRRMFFSII